MCWMIGFIRPPLADASILRRRWPRCRSDARGRRSAVDESAARSTGRGQARDGDGPRPFGARLALERDHHPEREGGNVVWRGERRVMTQHLASLHISNTAEATLDAKALNRALHHHLS